jgi:spore maturation protein B
MGLANSATPFGIKAMQELQKEAQKKGEKSDVATNSMCTLLAMNTAGFQLIPTTVLAILVSYGSKNPTEIIIPCLIVTSIAFISAILIISALVKKVPAYEVFTTGAKEGFWVGVKIIPYLVAIMVAVSMFRASGAIEILGNWLYVPLNYFKIPVDTLPLMITRSLSGSASLGVFSEIVQATGVESYATKLSAVILGSSETTFYVLAVYFGAVGVKKFRHALLTGILADIIGIVTAVIICRVIFL